MQDSAVRAAPRPFLSFTCCEIPKRHKPRKMSMEVLIKWHRFSVPLAPLEVLKHTRLARAARALTSSGEGSGRAIELAGKRDGWRRMVSPTTGLLTGLSIEFVDPRIDPVCFPIVLYYLMTGELHFPEQALEPRAMHHVQTQVRDM